VGPGRTNTLMRPASGSRPDLHPLIVNAARGLKHPLEGGQRVSALPEHFRHPPARRKQVGRPQSRGNGQCSRSFGGPARAGQLAGCWAACRWGSPSSVSASGCRRSWRPGRPRRSRRRPAGSTVSLSGAVPGSAGSGTGNRRAAWRSPLGRHLWLPGSTRWARA